MSQSSYPTSRQVSSRRLPTLPALPTKPTALERGRNAFNEAATHDPVARLPQVTTDEQLGSFIYDYLGIRIPDTACCPAHVAPLKAVADAFFGRVSVAVWEASRGSSKSLDLASLAVAGAILKGASISVLGGSGEQAQRVHAYSSGEEVNLPNTFWHHPAAPTYLLASSPEKYLTVLTNGGRIRVLMASQRSVRGPHPNWLLFDECDSAEIDILDAALNQPLPSRGIAALTVLASTHQNPNGTMTEIKRRCEEFGIPIYRWCYRVTLKSRGGWLDDEVIEQRKRVIPAAVWEAEMELQEPTAQGRAFVAEKVDECFDRKLGYYPARGQFYYESEAPDVHATYVTAADWAQEIDKTVIASLRTDCTPMRLVAVRVFNRLPWPAMIEHFNWQCRRYKGKAAHDATGLGGVLEDFVEVKATPVILSGKRRYEIFSRYIAAVEHGLVKIPLIEYLYREMKFCSIDDLYGGGHPPDTIVACAIAYAIGRRSGWSRSPGAVR